MAPKNEHDAQGAAERKGNVWSRLSVRQFVANLTKCFQPGGLSHHDYKRDSGHQERAQGGADAGQGEAALGGSGEAGGALRQGGAPLLPTLEEISKLVKALLQQELKPVQEQLEQLQPMKEQLEQLQPMKEQLKRVEDGVHGVQSLVAQMLPPIWDMESVSSKASSSGAGAKRGGDVKIQLCRACGYKTPSLFLECQLTGVNGYCAAVKGAHVFPYGKGNLMPQLLGCNDVNDPKNMMLLVAPVERAFDLGWFTFVMRGGKLVSRWLNYTKRDSKIMDLCTSDEERTALRCWVKDATWAALEGRELQQPDTWRPLKRAFALHATYSLAEAKEKKWLDSTYQGFCQDDDEVYCQSETTPQSSVALWAVVTGSSDPLGGADPLGGPDPLGDAEPPEGADPPGAAHSTVDRTLPSTEQPSVAAVKCACQSRAALSEEGGTFFWVCARKDKRCSLHTELANQPPIGGSIFS